MWVDETRPLLQGARLTAWELGKAGMTQTLVADTTAGPLMREGKVRARDRRGGPGDRQRRRRDKVGTYGLAILADRHDIPFVVAAPVFRRSTRTRPTGASIEIEERAAVRGDVVRRAHGSRPTASRSTTAAFDVTPAALVTSYITEDGIEPGGRA